MNLKPIENILRHQLAPSLPENKLMDKFKVKLQELPDKSFNSFYEVEYLPQTNDKHIFYLRTIKNTVYDYLEAFSISFNTASNSDHKEYLLTKAINSILQYFKDTQEVIELKYYNFVQINNAKNRDIRDEIYIIHLIKNYLIALYLEIKEVTQNQLSFVFLDEAAIQAEFFHTYDFKSCINEVPEQLKQELQSEQFKKSTKIKFVSQPYDFRGKMPDVLSYEDIIIDSVRFSIVEEKLYQEGFIDKDYFFIKSRAKKNSENLALVILALIKKRYFRAKLLKKDISAKEYRKFVDNRYKSNIERQMRNFENKPDKVTAYVESSYWLSNLPSF